MAAQQHRPTLAAALQDSELVGRRRDFKALDQSDEFHYDANHVEHRLFPVACWSAISELYSQCILSGGFAWLCGFPRMFFGTYYHDPCQYRCVNHIRKPVDADVSFGVVPVGCCIDCAEGDVGQRALQISA